MTKPPRPFVPSTLLPSNVVRDTGTDNDGAVNAEQVYLDMLFGVRDAELAGLQCQLDEDCGRAPADPQERVQQAARTDRRRRRQAELSAVTSGLCFGRIEHPDGARYIGRVGLRAEAEPGDDPLLVDWRAPVARSFYTATAAAPQGPLGRRHIRTEGRTVTGVDDEDFGGGQQPVGAGAAGRVGEAALIAALDRRRTGRMGDIVATLQAEQDSIVRAPHHGCLVVQGGPGTGKTVVALHRAAYLLFTHARLAERGVLVVGPSAAFLDYIDQVLPSLGETQARSATLQTLVPGVVVSRIDEPAAASLKGSALWADVLARAVQEREPAVAAVEIHWSDEVLVIEEDEVADLLTQARREVSGRHRARSVFRSTLLDLLAERVVEAAQQLIDDAERGFEDILAGVDKSLAREGLAGESAPKVDPVGVRRALESDPDVALLILAIWPLLDPAAVLEELLGDPTALRRAAPELTVDQLRSVERSGAGWSVEDVALLDEIADLVGAPDPGNDDVSARTRTVGHVIVDEAQELSPMQWRMLVRRCPTRSFTVVGDVNQVAAPGGSISWTGTLAPIFGPSLRQVDLTVCYRTPREVMERTAPVLRAAGSSVPPPEGARSTGIRPWRKDLHFVDLPSAVSEEVEGLLERHRGGTVAVIAPEARLALLRKSIGAGAVLITPQDSKGLEFDAALVIDPAGIVADRRGWNALYVAMTRCTQELGLLCPDGAPTELDGW